MLEEVAARCAGETLVVAADHGVRSDVKRVVDVAIDRFGRIDVWINNAGRGITRMPSELTDEDVDAMMRANVMTVLYGMQEVLPHFQERGTGQIVNVSSLLGRVPFATFRSAYCGAKHFMNALTATFRAEIAESHPGIVVTLVSPGVVRTDFGLSALHGGRDSREIPQSQSAEEVAEVIADVIETPRPDIYTRAGARERILGYYESVGMDP
jgi:NAD(P)-dependent dehydrogenase (short-subunit alcohol dehydrogenase family)